MGQPQRVTIEQIVQAYRETGSVWKAAKKLGVVGQSVWERLKAIDYPMASRRWTREEILELTALVPQCQIAEIARRLGRPYYGVALMASRLGLANRTGNRMNRKPARGVGLTKKTTRTVVRDLQAFNGSLRKFCRARGFSLDSLAAAIQVYEPEFWESESRKRGFEAKRCPNCDRDFYPMTAKQLTCTRRCSSQHRSNQEYFGGKRNNAVGLRDGVCQLCLREKTRGLSAHHVIGKKNDPENELLVALCPGCHNVVTALGAINLADTEDGWERLIELVAARRLGEKKGEFSGVHVAVDLEFLTEAECIDLGLMTEVA